MDYAIPCGKFLSFFLTLYYTAETEDSYKKVEEDLEFSGKMIYYYNIIPGAAVHVSNLSPVGSEAGSRKAYDVWLLSGVAYCITN